MSEHGLTVRNRAALVGAVEQQMLEPAQRAGYELPVIGTSEPPQGELLWKAPTERWWLFNDHRDDPTVAQYGGVVVPPDVREKLTRLLAEGFAPDLILVGHELPNEWAPGRPLPELVPRSPRPLPAPSPRVETLRAITTPQTTRNIASGAWKVGKAALGAGITVGKVTGVMVAAVAAAAAELDPVIVSGVRVPGTDLVTFVEVARWEW